jgi:hypothetical protein
VSLGPAATGSAEREREMPGEPGARSDCVAAALASLHGEERRLERLELARPLARCRAQRRYWEFVGAVLALGEREAR